jgi:hypothetical protein
MSTQSAIDAAGGATPEGTEGISAKNDSAARAEGRDRWTWKLVRATRARLRPQEDKSVEVELEWEDSSETGQSFLVAYWETQHQRIAAHENFRVQASGFVIAASLLAAAASGTEAMTPYGRIAIWLAIALGNVIAIGMIRNELRWIKVHQARAIAVLTKLGSSLEEMQHLASKRWKVDDSKRSANKPRFTSTEALILIHLLVSAAALVVAICASIGPWRPTGLV